MKKILILSSLLFFGACNNKDKAKYVAKSAYDELSKKYEQLELENKLLKGENRKLNNENEILKHDLEKYKDGFKSMYE